MVYQNPGTALNPSIRVGKQLAEVFTRPRRRARARRASARWRCCARCRSPTRLGHGALSAPALGRHAAARRDRDGARVGPGAPDPRRADDRPRRDGRGRGARPHHQAAGRVSHRRPLHQPQPRRDREDVLARGRALRRASWSRRARPSRCCTIRGTRTRWACCAASRAAACARITAGWTRSRASSRRSAPISPGCVFADRCALAEDICRTEEPPLVRRRRRARQPLLLPRAGAEAAARDGRRPRRCRRVDRSAEPLLELRRPRQDLPASSGHDVHALGGVSRCDLARRDARARRRVRLRQDDVRAHAARHRRADARAPCTLDGRSSAPTLATRSRDGRARAADRLPEPGLGAQPPPHGAPHPAPLAQAARGRHGQGGRRAHRTS